MPIQAPQWTEFLSCPICYHIFDDVRHRPISLACGHTVCKLCLTQLPQKRCPFDQNTITRPIEELPVNFALLQLVGVTINDLHEDIPSDGTLAENIHYYNGAKKAIEELAMFLKPLPQTASACGEQHAVSSAISPFLTRPMQRKLVTLVNCQLIEEEGRTRAVKAARSLGERTVTEMILLHQNPQQLSANLWAAVRARGCQFLGPAMQEEVLKLILLALEDGSALSRKVLVLFVVQRLETQYPQASKTAIGHVVQLLYRASSFKVTKREEESSLMQLKEEFRAYDSLRREHDSQIVQIATEAGLRISPEQWSSLLYGDTAHKSHMQSIIDKLQTPQSFSQSINELTLALQRTGDPGNLSSLNQHLELLASIDPNADNPCKGFEILERIMQGILAVVTGLIDFTGTKVKRPTDSSVPLQNTKYKTSMCRDLTLRGQCPRGSSCTFAHSHEEMERYRSRNKLMKPLDAAQKVPTSASLSAKERKELQYVTNAMNQKLAAQRIPPYDDFDAIAKYSVSSIQAHTTHVAPQCLLAVPVAKPSQLPHSSHKPGAQKEMIYTSPTGNKLPSEPVIVPIIQKAPNLVQATTVQQNPAFSTSVGIASNESAPIYPTGKNGTGTYSVSVSTTPQTCMHSEPIQSAKDANVQYSGSPEDTLLRNTMQLPPNPYTLSRCGLNAHDTALYNSIAIRTRGKSPSQHLDDLQKRRDVLVAQLSAPDNSSLGPSPMQSPKPTAVIVPSTHEMLASCRQPAANLQAVAERNRQTMATNQRVTMPNMRSSVADSMATTHSTLSLSKGDEPSEVWYEDYNNIVASTMAVTNDTEFHDLAPLHQSYQATPDNNHSQFNSFTTCPSDMFTTCQSDIPNTYSGDSDDTASLSPNANIILPWSSSCGLTDHHESYLSDYVEDDEFVPFEHTIVSKYGPISRISKSRMKQVGPVNVTAGQNRYMLPVTAVTPFLRPFPTTSEIPSQSNSALLAKDHQPDPYGHYIASSLPTALMKPNLIAAAINTPTQHTHHVNQSTRPPGVPEPHTLWALKEKMMNQPNNGQPCAHSTAEREQIRHELSFLSEKIQSLQMTEKERLSKELQTIELNIRETRRHLDGSSPGEGDFLKATVGQEEELKKQNKKKAQVAEDRRMAEQIAMEEAAGFRTNISQP